MDTQQAMPGMDPEADIRVDETAVRIFLDNHEAFKRFLRKNLPSDSLAEDLLQQSILKALRNREALSSKENPVAWFYRILRNTLTDFYRARAAEGRKLDGLRIDRESSGEDEQAPSDEALMGEVCACMSRLIPALKPEYADLIRRIDLGEEEPAAVAGSLGITYNNLMVRLHRSRSALRKSLEKSCGACTEHGCLDCSCGKAEG